MMLLPLHMNCVGLGKIDNEFRSNVDLELVRTFHVMHFAHRARGRLLVDPQTRRGRPLIT